MPVPSATCHSATALTPWSHSQSKTEVALVSLGRPELFATLSLLPSTLHEQASQQSRKHVTTICCCLHLLCSFNNTLQRP
jgi:hypothetical protein